ncbi:zinc-ribbon domain-containing protein [Mammaliicoccus sciuri]|uniref:zinc ribbon domain-containing protein n=1 Tax=Mammaliicoccus sciuri TaxID=1296 RepID=UPI002DB86A3E|nr:zinc-ribbon domain-containing protein [Mammaliicoccus sciuri]MEB6227748.1 zinc-ribbon domain-containing protein [Mammaliicoccus sciuri]
MKFCPECGTKLEESVKFCPECGYKIVKQSIESNEVIEVKEKMHSEDYIKNLLNNSYLTNLSVAPDISEKILVIASVSIAEKIDPNVIIAVIDTSTLSNGKTGIVFTGSEIFIKNAFESSKNVPLKNIENVQYESDTKITDKGKVVDYEKITIHYKDGESVILNSEELGNNFPFKLLETLLKDFNNKVDKISSKNQVVQLRNMKSEIILLYFRIVIAYLKDDDGIIDSKEYKELVSLMTKVKVSKEIASKLRDYRFEHIEEKSIIELIDDLKEILIEEDLSELAVQQSLGMDILAMHSDELDEITKNEVLIRMLKRLNMTDDQIKFTVRKLKAEKEILENRLTDNQIKEVAKELAAIAGGAGVSLGALAITGAVSGIGASVSSGLMALGFTLSTGGLFLGLAAVTTAGYGMYKGVKYFSGTNESEKYGIRIQTLNDRISQLRIANSYIMEDINWLSNKSIKFAEKLKESNELSNELYQELEFIITQNQSLADAGALIESEETFSEYELIISSIPPTLNIGKYNELFNKNVNKVYADEIIKKAYIVTGDLDNQSEISDAHLREDIELEELKTVQNILEEIGYFDVKSASLAQGKSIAKKGFSSLKKSLLNGNKND